MKKLVLFLMASALYGAGTITQSDAVCVPSTDTNCASGTYAITINATADAADGSFPTATLSRTGPAISVTDGLYISQIETNPGSTAPTDNWDLTMVNAESRDMMGGNCINRDTSTTEVCVPATVNPPISGAVTITITGNSVNSATIKIIVYLVRDAPLRASSGGGAGTITEIQAGNGVSVTSGTGPIATVAADFADSSACTAGTSTTTVASPSCVATALASSEAQSTVTWIDADRFSIGPSRWSSGQTTYDLTGTMYFQNTGWNITAMSGDNPVTLTLDTATPPSGRAAGTNVWIDLNDDIYIAGVTGTNCTAVNGLQRVVSKPPGTTQITVDVDLPGACTPTLTGATAGVAPAGPNGQIVVSGWSTGNVQIALDAAIGQKMCYYTVANTCSTATDNYAIVQLPDVDNGGYGVDPRAILTVSSGDISSTITAIRTPYGSPNDTFGDGLSQTISANGTAVAVDSTVCRADGTNCSTGGNGFISFTGPTTSTKTFTLPNATSTILTTNAAVTVAQGGTGLTSGTSGGVPYFSGTTTIASSGALTANLPVIGGGAGAAPTVGTRSGNTTEFVTNTGSKTSGTSPCWDANGNLTVTGCSSGSSYDPFTTTILGPVVEEFIGGGVPTNTSLSTIGNSGLVTYCNSACGAFAYNGITEAAHPGVVTLTTANITSYEVGVTSGRGGTGYPQFIGPATLVGPKIMCIFKTSSSISSQMIFCGTSYTGTMSANRIGIEYDTSASDTNWMCVSGDSDSSTRTSTGTSVATDTWYTATLEYTSAGNYKCTVNSNNVTITPVAGNITSLNLNAYVGILTRAGAQAVMYLDKFVIGGTATGR